MRILVNEEIPMTEWQQLLETSPHASPFQGPGFYRLFNSVPGLEATSFACENEGEIRAICVVVHVNKSGLKGFFSRRAIIFGGPVVKERAQLEFENLIQRISLYYRTKAIYIESRSLSDYSQFDGVFKKHHWRYLPYLNYKVHCSDAEEVRLKLSKNRKRQIKKALENGAETIIASNVQEVDDFYWILYDLYKNKVGKPLMPQLFFQQFFLQNLGKFFLVKYQGRIIGGIMCPLLENRSLYEFYIGGRDNEFRDLSPSVMATWAAIEFATQNNIRTFDFMGAGRKDQSYSVREFKERFGGELVEYGREIRIYRPLLFKLGTWWINNNLKLGL